MNDEELFSGYMEELIIGMSDHTVDAQRPFTGQPHTYQGQRGMAEVRGIRFRDLADCVAKAWIHAAAHTTEANKEEELRRRADDGTLNYNDLYELQIGDVDPVALIQCVTCEVEKVMGIYPNIEPLRRCE